MSIFSTIPYLKFTKDNVYECVHKDVYLNNRGQIDFIAVEGWQKYFVPLDSIDISEVEHIINQKTEEYA